MAMQRLGMRLDHVRLESTDPKALAGFYGKALKAEVGMQGEGLFACSADGRRLLIARADAKGFGFSAFAFADETALGAYRERLTAKGFNLAPAESPWFGPTAFALTDPDGNRLEFGVAPPLAKGADQTSEARLQHYAIATTECPAMRDFYIDALGFGLSDEVIDDDGALAAVFLHTDDEHHAIAIFRAPEKRLDHIAYETRNWNDIRDWADHLSGMEVEIDWGPGRHGIGNNLFIMICDPEGTWFEFSAELEVLAADRGPGRWPHGPRALNLWGQAVMRS